MLTEIHAGLKCVSGSFVASNRIVPSLNAYRLCFWRNIPFSSGSAALPLLMSPLTPLNGSVGATPSFFWACSSASFSGKLTAE